MFRTNSIQTLRKSFHAVYQDHLRKTSTSLTIQVLDTRNLRQATKDQILLMVHTEGLIKHQNKGIQFFIIIALQDQINSGEMSNKVN